MENLNSNIIQIQMENLNSKFKILRAESGKKDTARRTDGEKNSWMVFYIYLKVKKGNALFLRLNTSKIPLESTYTTVLNGHLLL